MILLLNIGNLLYYLIVSKCYLKKGMLHYIDSIHEEMEKVPYDMRTSHQSYNVSILAKSIIHEIKIRLKYKFEF